MVAGLKKLAVLAKNLWYAENGQDLVEYCLIVGCLTLGATAALNFLAGGISTTLTNIQTKLNTLV